MVVRRIGKNAANGRYPVGRKGCSSRAHVHSLCCTTESVTLPVGNSSYPSSTSKMNLGEHCQFGSTCCVGLAKFGTKSSCLRFSCAAHIHVCH